MLAPRRGAAVAALAWMEVLGSPVAARFPNVSALASSPDGDTEIPIVNPAALHSFALEIEDRLGQTPILDIGSTTERPISKREKRRGFEEFSYQVGQDEQNAARVAAGESAPQIGDGTISSFALKAAVAMQ